MNGSPKIGALVNIRQVGLEIPPNPIYVIPADVYVKRVLLNDPNGAAVKGTGRDDLKVGKLILDHFPTLSRRVTMKAVPINQKGVQFEPVRRGFFNE